MPRLTPVLSSLDFPSAELGALILDGEAYRLGDCVASIDQAPDALLRAAALCRELPGRLIAEQHTAAWVWGAAPLPPPRHEVCSDSSARARPPFNARLVVREVVVHREDVVELGRITLTTPMRTAIDLARCVLDWNEHEAGIVGALAAMTERTIDDYRTAMNRKRNLPNKRIALERIAECLAERA